MLLLIAGKVLNRARMEWIKNVLDKGLRDDQAGFRKDGLCTHNIATLEILREQSLEWNSSPYVRLRESI